jgi:hypothetical protein
VADYRQAPKYEQPLTIGKDTAAWWYRWFADTDIGTPPSSEIGIKLTGSPFSYTAPSKGYIVVAGGSVSAIHIVRVANYNTGQTQGLFPVSKNDKLILTYTGGGPTVTFFSQ